MRAAYIDSTGPTDVIKVGVVPDPKPGPGQVLVKIGAAAINPIDLYIRAGIVMPPTNFPYVIGTDAAGTIVELGPGASRFKVGDRVWCSNQGLLGRQGAASELAAIAEDYLYPTPDGVSDEAAAATALVGITAHLGLFQFGRLKAGEVLYVSGGSGGVGSLVIQMAKAAGAVVATTAGSPERVDFCRGLGADLALNYKTEDVPARLREFSEAGVDLWFETQREPNLEVAIPLLKKRGRMIVMAGRAAKPVLPLGQFYPRDCSLLGFAMFNASPDEQRVAATDISKWLAAGTLRPHIGKVFPLDHAAEAEKLLEENTVGGAGTLSGKVVIKIA